VWLGLTDLARHDGGPLEKFFVYRTQRQEETPMAQEIPNTNAGEVAYVAAAFRLIEGTTEYSDADLRERLELYLQAYDVVKAAGEKGASEAQARLKKLTSGQSG